MTKTQLKQKEIKGVLLGYLECALWASTDENGEPLDSDFSIYDFSLDALNSIEKDISTFEDAAGPLLDNIENEQIGHDLFLTRNYHGAGFWDRGLGEIGDKLTDIAHSLSESSVYVSDSGQLEVE